MLSITEQLAIIRQCGEAEAWNAIGAVAATILLALGLILLLRPAVTDTLAKLRRMGAVQAAFLLALFVPVFIYGSTKRTIITDFKAMECPDSVTYTWGEGTNATINSVQVQRRLIGVTEDEAWENWGSPVGGGVKHLTVEGFTLDRDYEYRLKYIYTEGN